MFPMQVLAAGLVAALPLVVGGCAADPKAEPDPAPTATTTSVEPTPTPSSARSGKPSPLTGKEQRALNQRLIDAAWADDVRRARRLIAQGADVNWRDETVQSAFLIAASEGHLELLDLTLAHGADVDVHDSYDGTGLIRAAERGHWDVVGRLLRTPMEVDHVNNLGWVALHEAIILGDGTADYVDTVRALVAGGASLTIESRRDRMTPIEHARSRRQPAVVRTLAAALRHERPDRPDQALLAAAAAGDPDRVAIALRHGADLEARDRAGRTALLIAVTEDHLAVARLLVALGASPDSLDDQHDTPWLVTGVTGSVPMAELLLRFDPDLTIRNRYGGLSLIPASERGHVAYVRRVAQTKIDVNHVNDLGWTALLEAVVLGDGSARYVEIVRALLAHGADPTIPDGEGVTALERARDSGFSEIAKVLRQASPPR